MRLEREEEGTFLEDFKGHSEDFDFQSGKVISGGEVSVLNYYISNKTREAEWAAGRPTKRLLWLSRYQTVMFGAKTMLLEVKRRVWILDIFWRRSFQDWIWGVMKREGSKRSS